MRRDTRPCMVAWRAHKLAVSFCCTVPQGRRASCTPNTFGFGCFRFSSETQASFFPLLARSQLSRLSSHHICCADLDLTKGGESWNRIVSFLACNGRGIISFGDQVLKSRFTGRRSQGCPHPKEKKMLANYGRRARPG